MASLKDIISLYEYKYSMSSLFLFVLLIFIGFFPLLGRGFKSRSDLPDNNYIELSVLAVIMSIVYLAFAGIILALLPIGVRHVSAILVILCPIILGIWRVRHSSIETIRGVLVTRGFALVCGWLTFTALVLLLASVNTSLPDHLPDGAYVNKEHVSSVRIQSLTGNLPADNVIPYVAQEYLARGISFVRNSPILPGQVVSNRPILVSLVALPFRLAMVPVKPLTDLPTYNYVGTEWPDFRILLRDEAAFSVFLGIGVFLNSLLLLGMFLFVTSIKNYGSKNSLILSLLFMTSPYFIFQTLFTWPKSLAGFFVIAATFNFLKYKKALLPGAFIGLAFLSHPSALAYFIVAACLLLLDFSVPSSIRFRRLGGFLLAFGLILMPWFVWTKFVIGIHSDLVLQNVSANGISIYQFVWMRVANLMNAIFPAHLFSHGINFKEAYINSSTNLWGAVGTVFIAYVVVTGKNFLLFNRTNLKLINSMDTNIENLKLAVLYFILSCLLLNLLFSYPSPIFMHGWQPLAGLLLVFGVHLVGKSDKIFLTFCWAQIVINIITLGVYLFVHFTKMQLI